MSLHVIIGALDDAKNLHKICLDEVEFRRKESLDAAEKGNEKYFSYCNGMIDAMHEMSKSIAIYIERLEKRLEILKAIEEATEKGLYETNEHFTSSIDLEDTE